MYLTKNGYGTMVVMSIEQYSRLTDLTELKLDEADRLAQLDNTRMEHNELFDRVRRKLDE